MRGVDPMAARAIAERRTIVSNDSQGDTGVSFPRSTSSWAFARWRFLPLIIAATSSVFWILCSGDRFLSRRGAAAPERLRAISFAIDHIEKQSGSTTGTTIRHGLANRRLFLERWRSTCAAPQATARLALFVVDLERFRNINDTLGRPAGDELLKMVAPGSRYAWRCGHPGPDGADEFAVVLPKSCRRQCRDMVENTGGLLVTRSISTTAPAARSQGRCGIHPRTDRRRLVLKHAKRPSRRPRTRAQSPVYEKKMTSRTESKLIMENQLREAIDRGEFVSALPTQGQLATRKVTGAEALIRWNDPRTGLVPRGCSSAAGGNGMIHDVGAGRWQGRSKT
jgi:diguanylate cyclase (GGDEF)-like protein